MRKEAVFSWLAVVAIGVAHLVTASLVMTLGRVNGRLWMEMGDAEIPVLSRMVFQYSATRLALLVGVILAVISVGGLGYVVSTGKGRSYLPVLVAGFLMIALLHVVSGWIGVSWPLLRVNYGMTNQ